MKSKLISFIVALLGALVLWVYVVTVVNQVGTDTLTNIPVTFSGAEQIRDDLSLVITDGSDATVSLKVTCRRSVLARLTSGGTSNVSVVVDVSRIKKAGDYNLTYSVVYPNGVSNSEVTLSDSPRTVAFTVEHFARTQVPVKGVLNGSVAEGYYEAPIECSPRELTLEGPESVVNRVKYAQVLLEQNDLSETFSQICPFTLVDENGDEVTSEYLSATSDGVVMNTVEATQPVLTIKELPLVVEFVDGGGANADSVIWSVEPKSVTVAGIQEDLAAVNRIVVGKFDLALVDEPVDELLSVVLPAELVNLSELFEARAHIEINEKLLATKSVRVTNFWPVNRPEGYDVDVLSVQLMVKIRGPKDVVSRITGENLRAVIDASELNEGTQTVPVTIEISGASGAAALGEYTASVSLARSAGELEGEMIID